MAALSGSTKLASLNLSKVTSKKLAEAGLQTLLDVSKVDFATLSETVGFSAAKDLFKAVRLAGLEPFVLEPNWSEEDWHQFLNTIISDGLVSWKEAALAVCGELNPPQVGTAIASNASFQKHYKKGKTMQAVMTWFYSQTGKCSECGTRLFLEADHKISKQSFHESGKSKLDADTLENLQLLCKRCNVVKRPSHDLGGLSFAPAQQVLMWILLTEKPKNREDFYRLCRAHGLTMANVRFDEAWAFAVWLSNEGLYEID